MPSGEFNVSTDRVDAWFEASFCVCGVPCSFAYGGITCSVMGCELEVTTGRIFVRWMLKK